MRLVWDAWKAYAHRAGSYQSHALLNVAYFVVFGPSALVARASGTQLLDVADKPAQTYWRQRDSTPNTVEALERQF
ncbi:MAG: hypothetical protein JOZ81_25500 [Chloroflexi bacterium]|nr:hypothetical protein [Chloroflexota bacterium]MBV9543977.1 hypothetical protein [Chloroflexota bacterium]